jgi:uncharacterized protein YjbI with pentapeptide repeats
MTIKELKKISKCPEWLLSANTQDADVSVTKAGYVTWNGGDFLGGNFRGGDFRGGDFLGGNFLGGNFRGGNFRGGNFLGGNFLGGNFLGGNVRGTRPTRILTLCHVDGCPKTLCAVNGVAFILAGCRWFTLAEARKHWSKREDRTTTFAMLRGIEAVAKQWKLKSMEKGQ